VAQFGLERPPLELWRTAANVLMVAACFGSRMFVYVLRSLQDGTFYVGATDNINERIKQHNRGESLSTKKKTPWELMRVEKYDSKTLALKRERFLKTGKGREALRNLCL